VPWRGLESYLVNIGVSVVIPTYNRDYCVYNSVMSVLCQTHKYLEVIVVDDCSTDNTIGVLSSIADSRLRVVKNDSRKGACASRNIGVDHAVFDVVAFQDSDDIWLPHKLSCQLDFMSSANLNFVFCTMFRCGVDKGRCEIYPKLISSNARQVFNKGFQGFASRNLVTNLISTQTLLAKKNALSNIGRFDQALKRFQDWDLSIRVMSEYDVGCVNEPLVVAYLQNDSITKNFKAGIESREIMLKKYSAIYKGRFEYFQCRFMIFARKLFLFFKKNR